MSPPITLAHERSQAVGGARRECRSNEPAQPKVHVSLGRQDADLLTFEELRVGDPHQLRNPADGAVPALVAKNRRDILVVNDRIAEHVANDPLVGIQRHAPREPLIERALDDLGQVEV
jgi:hypothetical protein